MPFVPPGGVGGCWSRTVPSRGVEPRCENARRRALPRIVRQGPAPLKDQHRCLVFYGMGGCFDYAPRRNHPNGRTDHFAQAYELSVISRRRVAALCQRWLTVLERLGAPVRSDPSGQPQAARNPGAPRPRCVPAPNHTAVAGSGPGPGHRSGSERFTPAPEEGEGFPRVAPAPPAVRPVGERSQVNGSSAAVPVPGRATSRGDG